MTLNLSKKTLSVREVVFQDQWCNKRQIQNEETSIWETRKKLLVQGYDVSIRGNASMCNRKPFNNSPPSSTERFLVAENHRQQGKTLFALSSEILTGLLTQETLQQLVWTAIFFDYPKRGFQRLLQPPPPPGYLIVNALRLTQRK